MASSVTPMPADMLAEAERHGEQRMQRSPISAPVSTAASTPSHRLPVK